MATRNDTRRGVLLLIVLGLLALFALTGVTFVLVAGQHQRGSMAASRQDQYGNPPDVLLNEALLQVLRGSTNPTSVIGPHSLLEDMYGSDGEVYQVVPNTGVTAVVGGQLYVLQFQQDSTHYPQYSPTNIDQFYTGRVLTFLDGPIAGVSARIVRHQSSPQQLTILPLSRRDITVAGVQPPDELHFLINGRPFNGTGFGYKPASFQTGGSRLLDLTLGDLGVTGGAAAWELALLPNARMEEYRAFLRGADGLLGTPDDPAADEDYDAPDFQNMLLAFQVATSDTSSPYYPKRVIAPSLHRPALINYWVDRMGVASFFDLNQDPNDPDDSLDDLRRHISLRPDPIDHPAFDPNNANTVNPNFDPLGPANPNPVVPNPRWDVDNDGDGVEDSIWVDLGFPVQSRADGRQYKPLFAILCLDLDGRLNINAHGTTTQLSLDPNDRDQLSTITMQGPLAGMPGNVSTNVTVPVGSGYSPAEINLSLDDGTDWVLFRGPNKKLKLTLSNGNAAMLSEYVQVLHGRPSTTLSPAIPGRYGEAFLLDDIANNNGPPPLPGLTEYDDNRPPAPVDQLSDLDSNGLVDLVNSNDEREFIGNAVLYSPHGPFGSPPDLDGDGAVALNLRGQPVYGPSNTSSHPAYVDAVLGLDAGWGGAQILRNVGVDAAYLNQYPWATGAYNMGEGERQAGIDEPTELDLSPDAQREFSQSGGVTKVDSPYTVQDLEWILRPFDADSGSLESRLAVLAPFFATDPFRRSIATTESWDLPVPAVVGTNSTTANDFSAVNEEPTNLHVVDLLRARLQKNGVPNIDNEIKKMLPRDLLEGLRFDLNRPFGNNFDDDNNGVVDDPGEAVQPLSGVVEALWRKTIPALIDYQGNYQQNGVQLNLPFDYNGDGDVTDDMSNYYAARYEYAKALYVLLMLFKGEAYSYKGEAGLPNNMKLVAFQLAQWAVNAADFRDRDSIMTPFEYDINPFNGWDVDGNPNTTGENDRAVVWGCERPELLITETFAFHDRGIDDTANDDGIGAVTTATDPMANPPDPDFDQVRKPQGSLFIELYNPRNPNDPREYPAELYAFPGSAPSGGFANQEDVKNAALDLERLAPPQSQFGGTDTHWWPVWRIAIGPKIIDDSPNIINDPHEASLDPERPSVTDMVTPVAIERVVWLVSAGRYQTVSGTSIATAATASTVPVFYSDLDKWSMSPMTDFADKVEFEPANHRHLLRPGRYAVIGPRVTTHVMVDGNWAGQIQLLDSSTSSIELSTGAAPARNPMFYLNQAGALQAGPLIGTQIKMPLGIVINEPTPLNISQPTDPTDAYYVAPTGTRQGPNPDNPGQTVTYNDAFTPPLDKPLDETNNPEIPAPLSQKNGTEFGYKTAYLQRLANPLLPWNPEPGHSGHVATLPVNPYITVDWMRIDLTVYNGETNLLPPNPWQPDGPIHFASRQRNGAGLFNIWAQQKADVADSDKPPAALPSELRQSLGFINEAFTGRWLPPVYNGFPATLPWKSTDAQIMAPYSNPFENDGVDSYIGDSKIAYPWLNWNDRLFTSAFELMQVPATNPARLLHDYTIQQDENHYEDQPTTQLDTGPNSDKYPYGHLLNFFTSDSADPSVQETKSNFYRLFEYVHVPSRFSGNETFLDPEAFSDPSMAGSNPWHPPFNRISDYREPGRVNINTIADDGHIWRGIMNGLDQLDSTWSGGAMWTAIVRSRRGYSVTGASTVVDEMTTLHGATLPNLPAPTFFANPFRSFGTSYLVPIDELRRYGSDTANGRREMVDGTLLRRQADNAAEKRPLFAFESNAAYNNTDRNPYFRYQAFQKLGNMLTTRSNVYAVWITVGFFEVERVAVDERYPDGFKIVGELGADTGEVERHRAFYIIDRTRPVGFQRGQNLNVDDAILLKRIIE